MMIIESHIEEGSIEHGSMDQVRIDQELAWRQLLARDPGAEFFYAVVTTGVFCRPNCKSRVPLRSNVRFFATQAEARAAGFRACKRCHPEEPARQSAVEQMCAFIEREIARQSARPVRLAALGKVIGASPFTAQRIFKQAMGATPAQYQRALRANSLRNGLKSGESTVTEAIYEAGYGSSSRAYEAAPLGMTPGRFAAGGRGETLRYAIGAVPCDASETPFGSVIVGTTERGICWLALGDARGELEAGLRAEFPAATVLEDDGLGETVAAVLDRLKGHASASALPLDLRGTAFQLRVWKALQEIPAGETRTYSSLAAAMGMPSATRAVARACATNRVSVLVPCHRVVGVSGSLTGYRWGVERKRQLLAAERK